MLRQGTMAIQPLLLMIVTPMIALMPAALHQHPFDWLLLIFPAYIGLARTQSAQ